MKPKRHEIRGIEVEPVETALVQVPADAIDKVSAKDPAGLKALLSSPPGLTKAERDEFEALYRAICSDVKPTCFIEHHWCRNIAGLIWRLRQIEKIREAKVQSLLNSALVFLLIERTSENILHLMERVRDGDTTAQKRILELKAKYEITDEQIRACGEAQNRNELSRFDQEVRTVELARDRIIEFIEKRRFMTMANLRLIAELPKSIQTHRPSSEEG